LIHKFVNAGLHFKGKPRRKIGAVFALLSLCGYDVFLEAHGPCPRSKLLSVFSEACGKQQELSAFANIKANISFLKNY